ncbi:MAG: DNA mismatch repair protein MutL, partial [Bdellovibrionaceae bacterium]|nr:DNA mismatch repair protein MutL [Pseudobdellovibrionaceae bacterium]
ALLRLKQDLQKMGVELESLGPTTVGIKSAPAIIRDSVWPSLLEQMASDVLDNGDSYAFERKVGDICATLACHSVIRAGQALSVPEMESLLEQMDEFPLSSFCPHGRPVSVEIPFDRLERDFGRKL